jgi:hypothetical protein
VDKLSSPKSILVDKFRQTVDNMKLPFSTTNNNNERGGDLTTNDEPNNLRPSESSSSSSVSLNEPTNHSLFNSLKSTIGSNQSTPPNSQKNSRPLSTTSPVASPKLLSNFRSLTDRLSRRQSILRRHVSESNPPDETIITNNEDKSLSQPIYHNNPAVDVNFTSNDNHDTIGVPDVTTKLLNRSRSLVRQSTDTTCTFPIRRTMRRMESIETVEIPGLNGLKALRYLNDKLGKLQPDLYIKQTSQTDPTYGCGKLTFTLFYNQQTTSLIVVVSSIDNLPYRDLNSKVLPDPFIKVVLLPDRRRKFQTKVSKRTQSPQFNETFQFQISYEELRRRILLLSVYDFGRSTKRRLIGTVKIDDVLSIPDITSHDVTCTRSIVPGTEVRFIMTGRLLVSVLFLFLPYRIYKRYRKLTGNIKTKVTGVNRTGVVKFYRCVHPGKHIR